MSKLRTWRPNSGTVLGMIAIVIAVVGTAHASQTKVMVKRGDIAPGAVTAKSIAHGAVSAGKIRKGAVTPAKLAKGSVTPIAIAPNAVTAGAIAPGSVYGGALGTETIATKPIADLDAVPSNIEWTASNTEAALCGPGEALLGSGFAFTNPGNREATWLQALPVINGETRGVTGRIATNSGGTATAEIVAICLK